MKASLFELQVDITGVDDNGGSFRRKGDNGAAAFNGPLLSFFYHKLLSKPMPWFLDVGANTGAFTLLAAHVPHCKVFALEPDPQTFAMLQENCRLNELPAILLNYAAWSETKDLGFHRYFQHGMSRVEHGFPDGGEMTSFAVRASTIDNLANVFGISKCDFMKIDVEGAELHVLRGAEGLIEVHHPAIFLEWWPPHCEVFGYHPRQVDEWLARRGYSKQEVGHYAYYEVRNESDSVD